MIKTEVVRGSGIDDIFGAFKRLYDHTFEGLAFTALDPNGGGEHTVMLSVSSMAHARVSPSCNRQNLLQLAGCTIPNDQNPESNSLFPPHIRYRMFYDAGRKVGNIEFLDREEK